LSFLTNSFPTSKTAFVSFTTLLFHALYTSPTFIFYRSALSLVARTLLFSVFKMGVNVRACNHVRVASTMLYFKSNTIVYFLPSRIIFRRFTILYFLSSHFIFRRFTILYFLPSRIIFRRCTILYFLPSRFIFRRFTILYFLPRPFSKSTSALYYLQRTSFDHTK